MSKSVVIPRDANPFRICVNNVWYEYPAGATVVVPDEVASAIDNYNAAYPHEAVEPGVAGQVWTRTNDGAEWADIPKEEPKSEIFRVTYSAGDSGIVADKEFDDIKEAIEDGKLVLGDLVTLDMTASGVPVVLANETKLCGEVLVYGSESTRVLCSLIHSSDDSVDISTITLDIDVIDSGNSGSV